MGQFSPNKPTELSTSKSVGIRLRAAVLYPKTFNSNYLHSTRTMNLLAIKPLETTQLPHEWQIKFLIFNFCYNLELLVSHPLTIRHGLSGT